MRRDVPAGRYKIHESLQSVLCWYCERLAECVDHFPPISREAEVPEIQGWLVHSCNRCNLFLGNMLHVSLNSRKLHVHKWLREKIQIQLWLIQGMNMNEVLGRTTWSLERIKTARDEYQNDKTEDYYKKLQVAQEVTENWLKGLNGESK